MFFLWEKHKNVDLLNTKLFMVRIIFVKLPGWKKMKSQQNLKIAAVSCFDRLQKGNFRLFAWDVVVSRNATSFLASNDESTKVGIKTMHFQEGSSKLVLFAFCQITLQTWTTLTVKLLTHHKAPNSISENFLFKWQWGSTTLISFGYLHIFSCCDDRPLHWSRVSETGQAK